MLLLAVLTLPAPASASRAPTELEHFYWTASIGTAIGGDGDDIPGRCVQGRVSTVDERFGLAYLSYGGPCPPAGNGYFLMRKRRGIWKVRAQGSDPVTCGRYGVTRAIGKDLPINDFVPLCVPAPLRRCRPPTHPGEFENIVSRLRARRATCRVARRVSDAVRDGRRDPGRYRCTSREAWSDAAFRVTCVNGRRVVRFVVAVF